MKGGIGLMRKKALLIATNLTSICCVYKEKTDKDVLQIEEVGTYDLDRKKIKLISNKSFSYYNL